MQARLVGEQVSFHSKQVWESSVLTDHKQQKIEAGSWFINKKNKEKNLKQGGNLFNVSFNCRGLHNFFSSVKVRPQKTPPQSVRFLVYVLTRKVLTIHPSGTRTWTPEHFSSRRCLWLSFCSDGFPWFYVFSRVAIPFWIFCNRLLLLPETVD